MAMTEVEARTQMQGYMRAFNQAFARGALVGELEVIIADATRLVTKAFYINVTFGNELDAMRLAAQLRLAEKHYGQAEVEQATQDIIILRTNISENASLLIRQKAKLEAQQEKRDYLEQRFNVQEVALARLKEIALNLEGKIREISAVGGDARALNDELQALQEGKLRDADGQVVYLKAQIQEIINDVGEKAKVEQDLEKIEADLSANQKAQEKVREAFQTALTAAEKHHELGIDRPAKQRLGERILCMKLNAAADDLREADEAILGTLQQVAASRAAIEAATLVHGSDSLRESQLKAHQALLTLLKAQQKTRQQHCNTIDILCQEIAAYPRSNTRDAAVLNARSAVLLGEKTQLLQNNTAEIDFCHRKFELLLPSIEVAAVRVEQLQAEIAAKSTPSAKLQKELGEAKEKLRALSSTAEALLERLRKLRDNETKLRGEYRKADDAVQNKLARLHYNDASPEKKALDRARDRKNEARSTVLDGEQGAWNNLCDNHSSMSEPAPIITSELQIRAVFTAKRLVNMTRSPQEIVRSDDLYDRYAEMLQALRPSETAARDKDSIARNMRSIMKPLMPYEEKHTIEHWCEGSAIDFIERKSKEELAQSEALAIANQRYRDSHGAVTLTAVAADDNFYVVAMKGKDTVAVSLYAYISAQLKQLSVYGTSLQDREILDNIALALRSAEKEPGYKGSRVEEAVNAAIIKRFNEVGIDYPPETDPTVSPAASVVDAMAVPDPGRPSPVVLSAEVPFSHLRRGLLAQCYAHNLGGYPEEVPDPADPRRIVTNPIRKAVDAVLNSAVSPPMPAQTALVDTLEFRSHDRIDGYAITERKASTGKPAAIILEQGEGVNKATITFESAESGTRTRAEARSKNRDHEVAATAVAAKHLAGGRLNSAVSIDLSSVKRSSLVHRLFVGERKVKQNLQDQATYLREILAQNIVPVLEPYASHNAHTAVWNTYKALLSMDKKIGGRSDLAGNYLDVVCDRSHEELKESLIDALVAATGEVSGEQGRIRYLDDYTCTKAELMAGQDNDGYAIETQVVIKAQATKDSKAIKGDRNFIAPKGAPRDARVTPDDPDDDLSAGAAHRK